MSNNPFVKFRQNQNLYFYSCAGKSWAPWRKILEPPLEGWESTLLEGTPRPLTTITIHHV